MDHPLVANCRIESSQPVCTRQPEVRFPEYVRLDTEQCLDMADQYGRQCGFGAHVYVRATSIGGGNWGGHRYDISEYWVGQGCLVEVGHCPADPALTQATFIDDFEGSGTDRARCLQRADDYLLSCDTPEGFWGATATYYEKGEKVASRSAAKEVIRCPGESCNGLDSEQSPQDVCFWNTNTPYEAYLSLYDTSGNRSASLELEGAGNCEGYVRAAIGVRQRTPRAGTVWLEQQRIGRLPGTYHTGSAVFGHRLFSRMHRRNGPVRACGTVEAGDGIGAVSGCTAWR
jgi:hypothetical protein